MEFSARQLAEILKGTVEGDPEVKVNKLSKIEEGEENSLSFLSNLKYAHHLYQTRASVVIVNKDFVPEKSYTPTLIKVEDAYKSFALLLEKYNQIKNNKSGIEQPSFVSPSATIGKDIYLGAFAYIGNNAKIGDNVKIYPNVYVGDNVVIKENTILFSGVKVYCDCIIGSDCIIHAGVVVGADGFGFMNENNSKVSQIGNVVVEDNVEIGANTTIDRATLGSTIVRTGVKLDNLIQVGHNVEIGENTVICAQSGVAGSSKIGKNCKIGGQVGITGHLQIGNNVMIAAQSGILSDIEDNKIVQGSPAFSINDYRKSYVYFRKFTEIVQRITQLEKANSK